jgi:hypothetical protein
MRPGAMKILWFKAQKRKDDFMSEAYLTAIVANYSKDKYLTFMKVHISSLM